MEPHDDPEARIRELERKLADAARTSELGGAQYSSGGAQYGSGGAHTPIPPYAHGAPYAAPPRRVSGGSRPRWLVLAMAVVPVAVVGAAVAFFSANMSSLEGLVEGAPVDKPTVKGGGGSVDKVPDAQPTIPVDEPVMIALPGLPLSVSGVRGDRTVVCNDGSVSVSGVSNTVTITGRCVRLTVSGIQNVVTVDSADTIGASGFDNRITYRSGLPLINKVGDSNLVEQG